jgi:hypothetical protein
MRVKLMNVPTDSEQPRALVTFTSDSMTMSIGLGVKRQRATGSMDCFVLPVTVPFSVRGPVDCGRPFNPLIDDVHTCGDPLSTGQRI